MATSSSRMLNSLARFVKLSRTCNSCNAFDHFLEYLCPFNHIVTKGSRGQREVRELSFDSYSPGACNMLPSM